MRSAIDGKMRGAVWDDLNSYLWALWGYWKWLLAGSIFFIYFVLRRIWPEASAWLDQWVKSRRRKRIEIAIIVFALFCAGFLAWKGEHHARLIAEGQYPIDRHLTDVEATELKNVFTGREKEITLIVVSCIGSPEAVRYAHEFYSIFKDLKFNTQLTPGAYSIYAEIGARWVALPTKTNRLTKRNFSCP